MVSSCSGQHIWIHSCLLSFLYPISTPSPDMLDFTFRKTPIFPLSSPVPLPPRSKPIPLHLTYYLQYPPTGLSPSLPVLILSCSLLWSFPRGATVIFGKVKWNHVFIPLLKHLEIFPPVLDTVDQYSALILNLSSTQSLKLPCGCAVDTH